MVIRERIGHSKIIDQSQEEKSELFKPNNKHRCWRRFMNERATDRAYTPTIHEHAANCLTHGCLIIPSIIAAQRLFSKSTNTSQYWSSLIYGVALIFLFSCSTIFHCSCFHPTYRESTIRHIFHRLDRTIIYIFISSSYTPWLLIRSSKTYSTTFSVGIVWAMAIFGIIFQLVYHERHKLLETCCYVFVGVFPAVIIIDLTDHSGIFELAMGGFVFILGISFFKSDGIIPFAHAIWHCFVFFGAAIQYHAVDKYLMIPSFPSSR